MSCKRGVGGGWVTSIDESVLFNDVRYSLCYGLNILLNKTEKSARGSNNNNIKV